MTHEPKTSIPVRNIQFNRDPAQHPRWWLDNDPIATAFFNALSSTFPEGERFFIDSVRHYRDVVPPQLQAQIKSFIGQEAVHSREHEAFNALASESGYDIDNLEERVKRSLSVGRRTTPEEQLAATCALEHFTAILAHALLEANCVDLVGATEDVTKLWAWHAMEEMEHKAVAYDTYLSVTRSRLPARRYVQRTLVMVLSTVIFLYTLLGNMADLFQQDGLNNLRTWFRTLRYLFWEPGALRRILPLYLAYYRPGFHPWQIDDRSLLAMAEKKFLLGVA